MNNPSVGFIGLGNMVEPIARHLLQARCSLVIPIRSHTTVDEPN